MVREAASPIQKYKDDSSEAMEKIFVAPDGTPLKIWLSLNVPTRSTFQKMVEVCFCSGI
jgi:hypothetical protein